MINLNLRDKKSRKMLCSIKTSYSPEEELEEVEKLGELRGSRYYAVDTNWILDWVSHLKGAEHPGPIRTSSLMDAGKLKKNSKYGSEYRIFNLQQWIFLYSKYKSEPPIELSNPFMSNATTNECSIAHYLYAPETSRVLESEEISNIKPEIDFPSSLPAFKNTESELSILKTPSIDLFLSETVKIKKKVFCISLSEKYDLVSCVLNGVIGIEDLGNKISGTAKGELCLILCSITKKIKEHNYAVIKCTKLEKYLDNYYNDSSKDFIGFILTQLTKETNDNWFQKLSLIDITEYIACNSCSAQSRNLYTTDHLLLDCHKSLPDAFKYFSETTKLSSLCSSCGTSNVMTKEISATSSVLIITIDRFRSLPYPYKICTYTKFSKSLEINKKKYNLYAVITHEGPIETGKYISYCKRGRSWYSCSESVTSKSSFPHIVKQLAYKLIYYNN